MRSIVGFAAVVLTLLGLPGSTASGSSSLGSDASKLRHVLVLGSASIVAGGTERTAEVARNDHPFPVLAWVSWVITFPCGGTLLGDPVTRTIPANGGVARWRLDVATSADCVGTYTVQATITDGHGSGQDERTFQATPPRRAARSSARVRTSRALLGRLPLHTAEAGTGRRAPTA